MKNIKELYSKKVRSVSTAEREKNELEKLKATLLEKVGELEKKLSEIEGSADDQVLDDLMTGSDQASKVIENLSRLKTELTVKRKAVSRADQLLNQAQRNIWLAQAGEKRKEAAKLREQIEIRKKKTAELLKALFDFEECVYVPDPGPAHAAGGIGGPGAPATVIVRIPITQDLENKAAILETDAAILEDQAAAGKEKVKIWSISEDIEKLIKESA